MLDPGTFEGQGDRSEYACDAQPLGEGGYARVFGAVHKPSGRRVALKKLKKSVDQRVRDRMEREVTVMRILDGEAHVMPVLDFSRHYAWYVMPTAVGDAFALRGDHLAADTDIVGLLQACAQGLKAAHAANYVHRDLNPHNILLLADDNWVLSDWGLTRARPGHTTRLLTSTGGIVGTVGFIAPEVMRGESAGNEPAADIYSLGRVAAWAVEGAVPLAGQEMLPSGPFRSLVRAATREAPDERPSLEEFVQLLDAVDFGPPEQPIDRAEALVVAGRAGEAAAFFDLLELTLEHPEDDEVVLDQLPSVPEHVIDALAARSPADVATLAETMGRAIREGFGDRRFGALDGMIGFIGSCARATGRAGAMGPLEDSTEVLCQIEAAHNQFGPRRETRAWLERIHGEVASTVARVLRANPTAVAWYLQEGWTPSAGTDRRIKASLQAAPSRSGR